MTEEKSHARLGLALVVVGVVLRLAAAAWMDLHSDGSSFAAIGYSVAHGQGFTMPWGDETGGATPAPSHHFSPLYPAVLGAGYSLLGFGAWQTKAVAFLVSLAALATVWWCTRDLMEARRAWLLTGIVAVVPRFIIVQGQGYSENLVLLLFTVTLWAIVRSLKEPGFIVWAGLAAGLTYLARAQMGDLFIVAGLGGVAWRLRFRGLAAFRDPYYAGGALLFGTLWAAWTLRNVSHFGLEGWQSSAYSAMVQSYAFGHLAILGKGLLVKVGLFSLLLLLFLVPWRTELQRAGQHAGTERDSALWLSAGLVFVLGAMATAMFWTYEQHAAWWLDSERYLCLAYVPILWLVFYHSRPSRDFRIRTAAAACVFILAGAFAVVPYHFPQVEAAHELGGKGLLLGVDAGLAKYDVFPYVGPGQVRGAVPCDLARAYCEGQPDLILSTRVSQAPPGYHLGRTDRVAYGGANLTAWSFLLNGGS